jgi:hypothetical protein
MKILKYDILIWGSSVGITTSYGLEDRSATPSRNKIFLFSAASRPALGSYFLGGKAAEA